MTTTKIFWLRGFTHWSLQHLPYLSPLFVQLMCWASVLYSIITMNFNKLNVSTQETDGCFAYVLEQNMSKPTKWNCCYFLLLEKCCIVFMFQGRLKYWNIVNSALSLFSLNKEMLSFLPQRGIPQINWGGIRRIFLSNLEMELRKH